jgi:hypothetical protein
MPDRRETLTWLLRALALGAAPAAHIDSASARQACGGAPAQPDRLGAAWRGDRGYGRDPDLLHPQVTWALTLTAQQKTAIARLADVFLPEDGSSPAASAVGVPDFIDEWVSAPYPQQQQDRVVILEGLNALGCAANELLHTLDAVQAQNLVAGLHARAAEGKQPEARFFDRFRHVCLIGYYTTPVGVAELGYVGYQPSPRFAGPPPEVLTRLGV